MCCTKLNLVVEELIQPSGSDNIEVNSSRKKYGLAGAFIAALLIFLLGASYTVDKIHKSTSATITPTPKAVYLADATVIYGFWTDNSSTVKAVDLSSGKEAVLATLGKNVKHVKIINGKTISFIKSNMRSKGPSLGRSTILFNPTRKTLWT